MCHVSRPPGSEIGQFIRGYMAAYDIPRKVVSSRTGIHESTLSRKINGIDDFQPEEIFSIGVAIGETMTTKRP